MTVTEVEGGDYLAEEAASLLNRNNREMQPELRGVQRINFFTGGGNFFSRENFLTAAPGKFLTAPPTYFRILPGGGKRFTWGP